VAPPSSEPGSMPASDSHAESLSMVAAMVGEKVVFERVLELREALMDLGIAALAAVSLPTNAVSTNSTQGAQACGATELFGERYQGQRGSVAHDVAAVLDPILLLQMLAHESFSGAQAIALFDKVAAVVADVTPPWLSGPFAAWWSPVKARLEELLQEGKDIVEEIPFVFEECLEELWQARLDIANAQLPWVRPAIRSENHGVEFECFHLTQLLALAKLDVMAPHQHTPTQGTDPTQQMGASTAAPTAAPPARPRPRFLPLTETLKWLDNVISEMLKKTARNALTPFEVHNAAMLAILADRRPPMLLPAEGAEGMNFPLCGVQRLPEVLALDADRVTTWHAAAQRIALMAALGTVVFQVLRDNKLQMGPNDITSLKTSMLLELDHANSLHSALAGICTSVHMLAADQGRWIAASRTSHPTKFNSAKLSSSLASAADPVGPLRSLLHKRVIQVLREGLQFGVVNCGKPDPRNEGLLVDLRTKHRGGSRTGLLFMMEELEELVQSVVRTSELHRAVHAPLVQAAVSTFTGTSQRQPQKIEETTIYSQLAAHRRRVLSSPVTAQTEGTVGISEHSSMEEKAAFVLSASVWSFIIRRKVRAQRVLTEQLASSVIAAHVSGYLARRVAEHLLQQQGLNKQLAAAVIAAHVSGCTSRRMLVQIQLEQLAEAAKELSESTNHGPVDDNETLSGSPESVLQIAFHVPSGSETRQPTKKHTNDPVADPCEAAGPPVFWMVSG